MVINIIGLIRPSLAFITIPLSLAWSASTVLAHQKQLPGQRDPIKKTLIKNQYLLASGIFGTVASSAFVNMYPLRTLFFGLASLISLIGHIFKNKENSSTQSSSNEHNLECLEASIIGCFGLAAISKGNVLGLPKGEVLDNHSFNFPKVQSFSEVFQGWKNNFASEVNILKWNTKNIPTLLHDFYVGVGSGLKSVFSPSAEYRGMKALDRFRESAERSAPNCFRGAFQVTGFMRILAFVLMLTSFFINKRSEDNPETNFQKEHKENILNKIASWSISLSLIPAAISALCKNLKWGVIPNLLFNLSALFAIPGLASKFLPMGEMGKIAGAMCTKLLIATQMFAYAVSQLDIEKVFSIGAKFFHRLSSGSSKFLVRV